jgi:hypothetical protein
MLDSTKHLKPLTFLNFEGVRTTATQLLLPKSLTVEDWTIIGEGLLKAHRSSQWHLGDWWLHGEAYGERVEVARSIGLNLATVREYARVCKNVSIRIETLDFAHHQVVTALEPKKQKKYLEAAAQQNWSVIRLRQRLHQGEANNKDPAVSDEERAQALARDMLEALQQANTSIEKYQFPEIEHLSQETIDELAAAAEEVINAATAVLKWASKT